MTHTYKVSGMTCGNCKASVEKSLSEIPNVNDVKVDLEQSEATIKMASHVDLKTLQNALSDKYKISEKQEIKETNIFKSTTNKAEEKSEWRQLFPLFLTVCYITIASILLNYKPWNVENFMLDFMGLFYVVFSFFKLLDLKGFSENFKMYDPLANVFPAYGWIYPFIELVLGILFLMRIQIDMALIVTIIVLGTTTIGVTKTLLDKKSIQCACLGTALKLPMTKATFIENLVMLVMAVMMLIY